jgi:glycopeptide antibiotics resistance protein
VVRSITQRSGGLGAAALDGAIVGSLAAVLLGTLSPLDQLGAIGPGDARVNLVPFELMRGAPERYGVINLWLLTPLVIAVAQRWRRAGVVRLTLAGVLLSGAIEFAQLFHPARGTNVDDLIYNTGGALAGAIVGVAIRRLVRGPRRPPGTADGAPRALEAEVPLRDSS